jgi:crotonobetainyl-CoA:carnitine CoA-transferase CaiB-like acyl-CoA transferase
VRVGNRDAAKAPHGIYRCSGDDEWVAISIASQDEWVMLCNVARHDDWLRDPRFGDALSRAAHTRELDAALETWTRERTANEVTRLLQEAGLCAGAALNVGALLGDPHLHARRFVVKVDHPEAGPRDTVGLPWRIGEVADTEYAPAPLLGEHNRYVFGSLLGLSDDEIRTLIDEKVIE